MTQSTQLAETAIPTIRRVRHEAVRRSLVVDAIERVTPAMIRVTLQGDTLDTFDSAAPDDHIKVFVPGADGEPVGRDYTPRSFDPERRSLVLDFVDHDAGPAALWARKAKVGDTLNIGGPRGSAVIEGDIARWVLVGDETALPAIGRRIEEMPAGTAVTAIVAVDGAAEEQIFTTAAKLDTRWVHRSMSAATDPEPVLAALREVDITPGTFVWAAAEAEVARAIRRHLLEERGHPKTWIKASGYWASGRADGAVKNLDDG